MAIGFARLTIKSRSNGDSAVAAAAYRSGSALYDERTGQTHDYSDRKDVVHTEILLPVKTHAKFMDREFLWNYVESSEKRKDAQLAKELTIALPKELGLEQWVDMVREFADEQCVKHALGVDFAIHNKLDGNPHAHLLVTMRRLEYDRFCITKARDLNPVFYGRDQKKVYDLWGEKWRDYQNAYFERQGVDLSVDAQYLIPTKHQGLIRSQSSAHYVREENELKKEASVQAVYDSPDAVLDYLSERHATFSEKDISIVIFKHTESNEDFQQILSEVKSSGRLILLGYGEDGRERFTTRESYAREQALISQATALSGRMEKALSSKLVKKAAIKHTLQEEQIKAVEYLVQKGDVACLIGRAGTGKTHTMKAVKDLYTEAGYRLYGAALSGVAAKSLEKATGIQSDTIYSLATRIQDQRFQPKAGSVIVIDEAGMVSLKDMSLIIDFAKTNHCKVILLGDPDQLQPIMAGAPFRAILENLGFITMQNIQRQVEPLDRQASMNLADGKIGLAIDHYAKHGQFELHDADTAMDKLIDAWQRSLGHPKDNSAGNNKSNHCNVENQVILAHTKKQTAELNARARQVMLERKLIAKNGVLVEAAYGEITLSKGDRLVFLKNNYDLGVCNGDFGTIKDIKLSSPTSANTTNSASNINSGAHSALHSRVIITTQVGNKTVAFDTGDYNDFTYGYAVTVHKSQGTTFDRAFVYLSGFGWDRFLTYVAMTRHKISLQVFGDSRQYKTLDDAKRQLSRAPIRDNAIDYPVSFAHRRGFDSEKVLGRAINHLAGIGHKIKDAWLYLSHYETWVLQRERQKRIKNDQAIRYEARKVALFADLTQEINQEWKKIYREGSHSGYKDNINRSNDSLKNLGKAKEIHSKSPSKELASLIAERNRLAYEIYINHANYYKALEANRIELPTLSKYADDHLKRERILSFQSTSSEILRGKLASEIIKERHNHHKYIEELGLDWQAINLANWKLAQRKNLRKNRKIEAYRLVAEYAALRKDVARAWGRSNSEFKASGDNPNHARNHLRAQGLTNKLDKIAHEIYLPAYSTLNRDHENKPFVLEPTQQFHQDNSASLSPTTDAASTNAPAHLNVYEEALAFYKVDLDGLRRCNKRYVEMTNRLGRKLSTASMTTNKIEQKIQPPNIINIAPKERERDSLGFVEFANEWKQLENSDHAGIKVLLKTNQAIKAERTKNPKKESPEIERLLKIRNEVICKLLASEDIQFIEKSAPKAIQELRQGFYKQQLSVPQLDILNHEEWSQLDKGQGRLFTEDTKVLNDIKTIIFNNLHDKEKIDRLMEPLSSILNSMINSGIQKQELEKIAPKLYQNIKKHISNLNLQYNREYGQENERER